MEGKFGNAKRKGTLDRVMAKLAHASESVIHVAIVALNLDTWLQAVLFWLLGAAWAQCEASPVGLRGPLADRIGNMLSQELPQPARI